MAHDLHPEYLSTKYALDCEDVSLVAVQHHHAHIASCLADNGEDGPVIGVAFDGTGYGTDGTIWGGEFLIADLAEFSRAGFLAPVPLPGGAAAIRQPWRMAAAYLSAAYPDGTAGFARRRAAQRGPLGRRAGRGPQRRQLAADLERGPAVRRGRRGPRRPGRDQLRGAGGRRARAAGRSRAEPWAATRPASRRATSCGWSGRTSSARSPRTFARGVAPPIVAARFHHGVADAIARTCAILRSRTGLGVVALSGGVFQNLLLLDRTVSRLEADGFRVLVHGRVPPNDGGISLGQAAVAAARDRLLLRVFVRGFQEFPGHYAHGYVTRLERGRSGRPSD